MNHIYLIIVSLILSAIFFFAPLEVSAESAATFLPVATFIFAILAGFFVSRQNNRYNSNRSTIASFDGNISALYRSFDVFGKKAQQRAGEIIKAHYKKILDTGK